MLFKTITWSNFLNTGNSPTYINLDGYSTTLIVGENGAGKSTLLDALSFVLYGKAFRDINKPQLVNAITKKGLLVDIEFEISRKQYRIVRGMKPNIFEIYVDGKLINQDAASKDYQEHLEKSILKMNHKSFTQIVVLGSANFTPFMQLKPQERREVIEDILDIQIFSKMFAILKEKISTNKSELTEIKYAIQNDVNLINVQKKHINELATLKKTDSESKHKKIRELEDDIVIHEKTKSQYLEEISELESQIENIDGEKEKKKRLNEYVVSIRHKISNLRSSIKFFHENDDCPTCQRNIDEAFKTKILDEKNKELVSLEDGQTKLNGKIEVVDTKIEQMKKIQSQIDEKRSSIMREDVRIQAIRKNIKEIKEEMDEVFVDDGSALIELRKLEENKIKNEEKMALLNKEKNDLDQAYILLKDTGIKSKIIKQYIPLINKLIQKFLSDMDFFVNFELDETFKEKIESRYHDEFAYASFSEGEKLRIDLALMFTWRAISKMRSSSTTNLLIMDEVFDSSLDSTGTEDFMKIIEDMENTNIFIISHKGHLSDKFENQIRFEKYKGFSRCLINN